MATKNETTAAAYKTSASQNSVEGNTVSRSFGTQSSVLTPPYLYVARDLRCVEVVIPEPPYIPPAVIWTVFDTDRAINRSSSKFKKEGPMQLHARLSVAVWLLTPSLAIHLWHRVDAIGGIHEQITSATRTPAEKTERISKAKVACDRWEIIFAWLAARWHAKVWPWTDTEMAVAERKVREAGWVVELPDPPPLGASLGFPERNRDEVEYVG